MGSAVEARGGRARRAGRLLAAFWASSVAEELQYRANLAASVVATGFWIGVAVLTTAVFFGQTRHLGGWRFWEVVALLGVFNALGGVVDAVLRPNIGRLVEHVRRGTLDLILVRPVDAQLYVSFRQIVVWRVADIVLGLGVTAFALWRAGHTPTLPEVAAFALALVSAAAVLYALWVLLMSLAFWFVAVDNLSALFDAVYGAARYPVSAYPAPLRVVFLYLVPIGWVTTVPAGIATGRGAPAAALVAAGVAAAALVCSRWVWRAGLRRYTSAGG